MYCRLPKAATSRRYRLTRMCRLSAILLDNDYYDFIRAGRQEIDGLPWVGVAQLIALKARAWLDLTERARRGEQIDSKTIKKHKNDVFRLYQILDPAIDPAAPETVKEDVREFISRMRAEEVTSNPWVCAPDTRQYFWEKSPECTVSQRVNSSRLSLTPAYFLKVSASQSRSTGSPESSCRIIHLSAKEIGCPIERLH